MTVVLMYHGLGDRPASRGELRYTVGEAAFARQMEWLATRHKVVGLPELLAGRGPGGAVVVTFDDGEESVHRVGLPVLQRLGLTATVYVTTGWIGQPGYLSAGQLRELAAGGWTLGTHGVTHRYLSDLDEADLARELRGSRDALGALMGSEALHMSLPGGRADGRVLRAVRRAGYLSLALSVLGVNPSHPDPFAIMRATMLRSHGDPLFRRLAAGSRPTYLGLRARQILLDHAKHALGNRGYDRLRGAVLDRLGRR